MEKTYPMVLHIFKIKVRLLDLDFLTTLHCGEHVPQFFSFPPTWPTPSIFPAHEPLTMLLK